MLDQYPVEMRPFIEAILANPKDDAPVLIFADWLEENGCANIAIFCRGSPSAVRIHLLGMFHHFTMLQYYRSHLPPQVPAAGVYPEIDYRPIV